jgi:HPt (histidine-containing phosphotransfer) domain-containing protein
MATPVDPDFRARLAALNDKFAATVPGTLEKIRLALDNCLATGAEPASAALHQLHELLHGVAGSAGTFGFAVLGSECRRIEQMVRGVMEGGGEWAAVIPEVEKLLVWAAVDPRNSGQE